MEKMSLISFFRKYYKTTDDDFLDVVKPGSRCNTKKDRKLLILIFYSMLILSLILLFMQFKNKIYIISILLVSSWPFLVYFVRCDLLHILFLYITYYFNKSEQTSLIMDVCVFNKTKAKNIFKYFQGILKNQSLDRNVLLTSFTLHGFKNNKHVAIKFCYKKIIIKSNKKRYKIKEKFYEREKIFEKIINYINII